MIKDSGKKVKIAGSRQVTQMMYVPAMRGWRI